MIGCHMGRGAIIRNPLLIARELHVLKSSKKRWIELLLLQLMRDHHSIVGRMLVACCSVSPLRWRTKARAQDVGGRSMPAWLPWCRHSRLVLLVMGTCRDTGPWIEHPCIVVTATATTIASSASTMITIDIVAIRVVVRVRWGWQMWVSATKATATIT
jgi:hypothetical protein